MIITNVEPSHCPLINVGSGVDLTIRELAETIAEVVGYHGNFMQDTSKPDGPMRKIMDISKIRNLGWKPEIDLASHNYLEGLTRLKIAIAGSDHAGLNPYI